MIDSRTAAVGMELPPLVKGPITRDDLKAYAAASGDPNPMHLDDELARSAGHPGVFAHGDFDTWSPGYLMFIAATHNGISRLYETFGNAGADTLERTLSPSEYQRTWYKQNPPLPKAKWSQRNNNNYQQTALLTTMHYFANNSKLFLKNFYLKSKRSIDKPKTEGPAALRLRRRP